MSIFKPFYCHSLELLDVEDNLVRVTAISMDHAACQFGRWALEKQLLSTEKRTPTVIEIREEPEAWPFLYNVTYDGVYFTAVCEGPVEGWVATHG